MAVPLDGYQYSVPTWLDGYVCPASQWLDGHQCLAAKWLNGHGRLGTIWPGLLLVLTGYMARDTLAAMALCT